MVHLLHVLPRMLTGKWFSLAAEQDGQMTEITSRQYSGVNPDGTIKRTVARHTYETRVDSDGYEYEEIVDTWLEPGLTFWFVQPGTYLLQIAIASSPAEFPCDHLGHGRSAIDTSAARYYCGTIAVSDKYRIVREQETPGR
jgi:hypothetical protein